MEKIKNIGIGDILDLQNENQCLYVPDKFVSDIVKFMRAKKYLLKKKTSIQRIECGFSFSSNNYYNLIRIPLVLYDSTKERNVLGGIFEIMNNDYRFNIVEYAKENNINVKIAVAIFCILHELGHSRYNAYFEGKGRGENYVMSKYSKEYDRVYDMTTTHIEQADYEYRKIPSEIYADKMAIKIMKKHRVALRNIIKKNVDDFKYIDMTDEYNKKRYCDNFYRYFVRY